MLTPDQIRLRLESILDMRGLSEESRLDILIRHVLAEVLLELVEAKTEERRILFGDPESKASGLRGVIDV